MLVVCLCWISPPEIDVYLPSFSHSYLEFGGRVTSALSTFTDIELIFRASSVDGLLLYSGTPWPWHWPMTLTSWPRPVTLTGDLVREASLDLCYCTAATRVNSTPTSSQYHWRKDTSSFALVSALAQHSSGRQAAANPLCLPIRKG